MGLGRSQATADVSAPGGLSVVADGAVQLQVAAGQSVRVTLVQGQIQVAGLTKLLKGPVRLAPIPPAAPATQPGTGTISGTQPPPAPPAPPPAPANPVKYGGKSYRGEVQVLISPKDGKLSVLNVVNLEEYLLGVVPAEMPSGWPAEALKAQAVASRTFARYHLGGYEPEGFDVLDNTGSQEYGGIAAEKPSTSLAVAATHGQVLTYNGAVANAMYHSASGGHTEDNDIIYKGTPVPYLRGVPDFDNLSPNYSWTYSYSPDEFTKKMTAGGFDVGAVVTVSAAGQIGSSGRPSQWRVIGMKLSALLSGEQLRRVLGLPSSNRTVTTKPSGEAPATRTYASSQTISVVGADGAVRQRPVSGTIVRGLAGNVPLSSTLTARGATTLQQGGFVVAGGGSGHGVGLSQWGAYGMALQGKTYTDILSHYYQGTKIETR